MKLQCLMWKMTLWLSYRTEHFDQISMIIEIQVISGHHWAGYPMWVHSTCDGEGTNFKFGCLLFILLSCIYVRCDKLGANPNSGNIVIRTLVFLRYSQIILGFWKSHLVLRLSVMQVKQQFQCCWLAYIQCTFILFLLNVCLHHEKFTLGTVRIFLAGVGLEDCTFPVICVLLFVFISSCVWHWLAHTSVAAQFFCMPSPFLKLYLGQKDVNFSTHVLAFESWDTPLYVSLSSTVI